MLSIMLSEVVLGFATVDEIHLNTFKWKLLNTIPVVPFIMFSKELLNFQCVNKNSLESIIFAVGC